MRSWYYVRGIARIEREIDNLRRHDLCVALGISYTTLRRIRRGQPVSSQTLNRIQRGLKKLRYENCLSVEAPTRVLRLYLKPNTVRFNRIEYVEPNSLITVDVLEQLIQGRSFTKSFERVVRRFLKNIVIESKEYAILPIDTTRPPPRHVEEWKRRLPSLVEGDHMRDLYVFLRNNLSAFIEHSELYDKTHERIKKSGSVSVVELTIPTANMRGLSPAEQNLLLTFGLACNELAVLVRLAIFGAHHDRKGRMYEAFAASQQMTIMKLLAGKIHECWKLVRVRYFGSSLSKKYNSIIMRETKEDLKTLQRYFKSGSNIIARIRNEAAFHYSNADVRESFDYVSGKRECLVYMAQKKFWHELHFYAEVAMAGHLLADVHKDRAKAIRLAQDDVSKVGTKLASVMGEILQEVRSIAMKSAPDGVSAVIFPVELERRRALTSIPIFIKPTEYNVEYLRLARALGR